MFADTDLVGKYHMNVSDQATSCMPPQVLVYYAHFVD